jgi:hypothetical protein
MTTERHELEAWLGENHGLTGQQITELLTIADELDEQYPGDDDSEEREAALTMAYRLMVEEPTDVVDELAQDLSTARQEERRALAALRQGARQLIHTGGGRGLRTQMGYAQAAGVDRSAVINWMQSGKALPR